MRDTCTCAMLHLAASLRSHALHARSASSESRDSHVTDILRPRTTGKRREALKIALSVAREGRKAGVYTSDVETCKVILREFGATEAEIASITFADIANEPTRFPPHPRLRLVDDPLPEWPLTRIKRT